jgi:hypothetical protein
VIARRLIVLAAMALIACSEQQQKRLPLPLQVRPQSGIQATVVTIRTTLQPANRTTEHTVVIAGRKARSMDEAETWRLFDLAAGTVTWVSEIDRSYRTEPIARIIENRRAALRRPADRELPAAEFLSTGAERPILGVTATQSLVRLGGYQRELWFAAHPQIPETLFSMMHASSELGTRLGGIVARADEGLIAARGFPLADRAEMVYGKNRMIVERTVTRIEQKNVPSSTLEIPGDYREITAPAARRRPASSRPPGQSTPAAGSPPSSTTKTSP